MKNRSQNAKIHTKGYCPGRLLTGHVRCCLGMLSEDGAAVLGKTKTAIRSQSENTIYYRLIGAHCTCQ